MLAPRRAGKPCADNAQTKVNLRKYGANANVNKIAAEEWGIKGELGTCMVVCGIC